jgi:hypothetical protein
MIMGWVDKVHAIRNEMQRKLSFGYGVVVVVYVKREGRRKYLMF